MKKVYKSSHPNFFPKKTQILSNLLIFLLINSTKSLLIKEKHHTHTHIYNSLEKGGSRFLTSRRMLGAVVISGPVFFFLYPFAVY